MIMDIVLLRTHFTSPLFTATFCCETSDHRLTIVVAVGFLLTCPSMAYQVVQYDMQVSRRILLHRCLRYGGTETLKLAAKETKVRLSGLCAFAHSP
jgi:hypothetical protein